MTAVYKGTPKNSTNPAALLRSYDSRKEPAPEFNCTIWEAGRATSATALAFKPIQIGQSVFLDEGAGKYNPSPQILDEAVCNEWPGREVGVFVSIGTGKRPGGTNNQQHLWYENFIGGSMGEFAEARRKLIGKIEGCELTHEYMLAEHLAKRGVDAQNYYRLNVEVGVGEFGMNEWNRLSDISTSTRMYLAKQEVQNQNLDAAAKLARVHFAKKRHERHISSTPSYDSTSSSMDPSRFNAPLPPVPPPSNPLAVELPAEDVVPMQQQQQQQQHHRNSVFQHRGSLADMKYTVISADDYPPPLHITSPYTSIPPADYQVKSPASPHHIGRPSFDSPHHSTGSIDSSLDYRPDSGHNRTSPPMTATPTSAPPLPPKTPLPYPTEASSMQRWNMSGLRNGLPYPDGPDDIGPPPPVNVARKPEFAGR